MTSRVRHSGMSSCIGKHRRWRIWTRVRRKGKKQNGMTIVKWWGDIDENRKIGIAAFLSAAYFICLPLSIVTLPGGMSLLKAVTYVLGAVLVAKLFVGRDRLRLNSVHLFLGLYVVYSLFSWFIIRTDGAYTTLRGILEISLIFVMITSRVYNEREGNFLFNSWIVVGVITTVSVLLGQILKVESVFGRVSLFIGGGARTRTSSAGILSSRCCAV